MVCFLRASTSTAWPNIDGGMFLRRILRRKHPETLCILEVPRWPPHFTSDGTGGEALGRIIIIIIMIMIIIIIIIIVSFVSKIHSRTFDVIAV